MFGLITFDNKTFIIVKKDIIKEDKFPCEYPFEVYGFIYKQRVSFNKYCFSLVSDSSLIENEKDDLIKRAICS